MRGGGVRVTEGDVRHQEHHLLGQQELPVQEQECSPQGDRRHDGKLPRGLPNDGLYKEHNILNNYYYTSDLQMLCLKLFRES